MKGKKSMNTTPEILALSQERDFLQYCHRLYAFAKNYTVLIAVADTPCGSKKFTADVALELMRIGLTIPLHNKHRCSYAAIIDEGLLVFEGISQTNKISYECNLSGISVGVESICYCANDGVRSSKVVINGQNHALAWRGISFVVFDKKSCNILDSVGFDTYSNDIACYRLSENPIISEVKARNPGVVFISPVYPSFPEKDLSSNEKWILENKITFSLIKTNAETMKTAINEYIDTPEGIREVLSTPTAYIGTDGARRMYDYSGKYLNVVNGHRLTVNQPFEAKRTIYIIGGCIALGIGVRDDGTLASQLQKILNERSPKQKFLVENYGFFLDGTNVDEEMTAVVTALPLKAGDIVIGYGNGISAGNPELFNRPHDYGELFFDDFHYTETCHKLIAEQIYITLNANNFFCNKLAVPKKQPLLETATRENYGFSPEQLHALDTYKAALIAFYDQQFGHADMPPLIGAIVMNCNPFTLGHRYLIEQAAKKVDFLVVFVVQEDKSFFSFEERIDLVDKGTADLPNVGIIESGQFIISTLTFNEYFNKTALRDRSVDSSTDVTLFAREIAPAMHISIRFAGTEPFDRVTKQYNDTLSSILPRYGIAFEEIPRLSVDGQVVSASLVRKLLEIKDFDSISMLVPETTLTYLKEKFMPSIQ